MLPDLGITDTVGMHAHDVDSFHGISFNPYAAMPSLHVGWSLIVPAASSAPCAPTGCATPRSCILCS